MFVQITAKKQIKHYKKSVLYYRIHKYKLINKKILKLEEFLELFQ